MLVGGFLVAEPCVGACTSSLHARVPTVQGYRGSVAVQPWRLAGRGRGRGRGHVQVQRHPPRPRRRPPRRASPSSLSQRAPEAEGNTLPQRVVRHEPAGARRGVERAFPRLAPTTSIVRTPGSTATRPASVRHPGSSCMSTMALLQVPASSTAMAGRRRVFPFPHASRQPGSLGSRHTLHLHAILHRVPNICAPSPFRAQPPHRGALLPT